MNLSAYDIIERTVEKISYVNPEYRRLYTNEVNRFKFYFFLKRYNVKTKRNDYYIGLCNERQDNARCYRIEVTNSNLYKINLNLIWDNTNLRNVSIIVRINLVKVEEHQDSAIYYIDV